MVSLTIEDIAKLSDKEAKFALLKMVDPALNDNQAATLCDYAPKSGTQVKNRVAGKIGGLLAERGFTRDTIAEKLLECANARKLKPVFLNQYNDKGKVIGVEVEIKDLGPDCPSVLAAIKTAIMFEGMEGAENSPEQIEAPEMSEADLQKAVGRGGPTEVLDADFEVKDAASR